MAETVKKNDEQIQALKQRLHKFLDAIETIDPEETNLEDIDRLLSMIEDIEEKLQQVK
ncbi:SE1561 family protein [Bacillus carboniphilus]|uniref:SE1561 family protein n=1 Tax=Bacillus carboniphilus TaxID=86663 RepID=A0ABN0WMF4_9BACI